MKISRITALIVAGVLALAPAVAASAYASEQEGPKDVITLESAVVNRLGGVSITGTVGCEKTAQSVRDGTYVFQDEDGNTVTIPALVEGDVLLVLTNADFYTVTQPVGRRLMVRVTHESSRATPCYVDPGGVTLPDVTLSASPDGMYTWRTDQFGYDTTAGPLFDYSSDGKFAAGRLSVNGHGESAWIMVQHAGEWITYNNPDGLYLAYVGQLKATMTR